MPNIPEYRKVRQYVLDNIVLHEKHDERIISERELALLMNVSRLTVRYALKELLEEGILFVKKGKGMFVNPEHMTLNYGMARRNYKVMTLWGDGSMLMLDGFFVGILEQLCAVYKSLPVFLQNSVFTGGNGNMAEEISMYRPDGIFWVRPREKHQKMIEELRAQIPVCVFGNSAGAGGFSLSVDYTEAGRAAAEYFKTHGCKKTLFLGCASVGSIQRDMFAGWQENSEGKAWYGNLDSLNWEAELDSLLDQNPDGIFVYGSRYQFVDRKLAERRQSDVRLLTDENYWGTYGVCRQPDAKLILISQEMARLAAHQLFQVMDAKENHPIETIFYPEIIERENNRFVLNQ